MAKKTRKTKKAVTSRIKVRPGGTVAKKACNVNHRTGVDRKKVVRKKKGTSGLANVEVKRIKNLI